MALIVWLARYSSTTGAARGIWWNKNVNSLVYGHNMHDGTVPGQAASANPKESTPLFRLDAAGTLHLAPQTGDLLNTSAIVLSIAVSAGLLAAGICMQVGKRKKAIPDKRKNIEQDTQQPAVSHQNK